MLQSLLTNALAFLSSNCVYKLTQTICMPWSKSKQIIVEIPSTTLKKIRQDSTISKKHVDDYQTMSEYDYACSSTWLLDMFTYQYMLYMNPAKQRKCC